MRTDWLLTALVISCLTIVGCGRVADTSFTTDDVAVVTTALEHFREADIRVELRRSQGLPETSRTELVIYPHTNTNHFHLTENPVLDGAAQDAGGTLSSDLKRRFRRRNTASVPIGGIVEQSPLFVTVSKHGIRRSRFAVDYPKAKAYVYLWLPGYSRNGTSAIVSFFFGPRHHPTQAFYKLKRSGEVWQIEWHKFNYYL